MSEQPNIELLRATYDGFQCHGVVALIGFLTSPKGKDTIEIGSNNLGLDKIMNNPDLTLNEKLTTAWIQTHEHYIGSPDGSVTPLQWLAKLATIFGHVSTSKRAEFDVFCGTMVNIFQDLENVTTKPL